MRLQLGPALAGVPLSVSILKLPLLCSPPPHAQAIAPSFLGDIAAVSGVDARLDFQHAAYNEQRTGALTGTAR